MNRARILGAAAVAIAAGLGAGASALPDIEVGRGERLPDAPRLPRGTHQDAFRAFARPYGRNPAGSKLSRKAARGKL